jgi:protein involved in polysaccharide export with SLBB domain
VSAPASRALAAALLALGAAAGQASPAALAPGDEVELDVLGDAEPPRRMAIAEDGRVAAPLIGAVAIGGLTAEAAQALVERLLADGGYLVAPRVSLIVAAHRPVYVLGDVRTPGVVAYRPGLTVEQAVGLAGGPATAVETPENRLLARTQIEGDLAATAPEIAREALSVARLSARLAGRAAIAAEDLPAEAAPVLDQVPLERLKPGEERALAVQVEAHEAQRRALADEIAETETELDLLARRAANQETSIGLARLEADRMRMLIARGIRTATEEGRVERMLVDEESVHLAILAQISQARSRLGARRSELARIESAWREAALLEIQERRAAIGALLLRRETLARRLALVSGLILVEAAPAAPPAVEHRLRRSGGAAAPAAVGPLDAVGPGDVLIVTVAPPAPPAPPDLSAAPGLPAAFGGAGG